MIGGLPVSASRRGSQTPNSFFKSSYKTLTARRDCIPTRRRSIEGLILRCLSQLKVERTGGNQFPRDAIQGLAGSLQTLYRNTLNRPGHSGPLPFLTCLGSILSDRLTLNSAIRPHPRMFMILLGASANDRKSECIKQTINLFSEVIQEFAPCYGVGSAEGLARED